MEEGSLCPNCRQGKLQKPKVLYSVFDGRRQPDGVCENCGAFHWERLDLTIPLPVLKPAVQKEEQKPAFKELLEEEEKRREKRREKKRRWRRNRKLRKAMEAEKSRV